MTPHEGDDDYDDGDGDGDDDDDGHDDCKCGATSGGVPFLMRKLVNCRKYP